MSDLCHWDKQLFFFYLNPVNYVELFKSDSITDRDISRVILSVQLDIQIGQGNIGSSTEMKLFFRRVLLDVHFP